MDELIAMDNVFVTLKRLVAQKKRQEISVMTYVRETTNHVEGFTLPTLEALSELGQYRRFFQRLEDLIHEWEEDNWDASDLVQEILIAIDEIGIKFAGRLEDEIPSISSGA